MNRFRSLRVLSYVTAFLLALQFEFGIAVNLSPALQEVPALAPTPAAVWTALAHVGGDATTHALLGTALVLVALAGLVIAVGSGDTAVTLIGIVAFIAIALAAVNGILFTVSGFTNDGYSHGMASTFLVAFAAQFVQAILLTSRLARRGAGAR